MSAEISNGPVYKLSLLIGTTEPALKLLLTVLAGYPVALIHRHYFYGKNANIQHIFFILSGFLLGYWNYGLDMFHCLFATFFTYCTMFILKGTLTSVAVTFLFNVTYLLIGYYYCSTNDYDINWTMPHCILVLRLIGIVFDLYDGHQPQETLSALNKQVALVNRPTILEIYGHTLFPAAFIVGPQFPMKRYLDFVSGAFSKPESPGQAPDSVEPAVKRLLSGIAYLMIFQTLGIFVSDDYMASDEFGETGFFKRMLILGLFGRYNLYKYISCWLLTEGACILFGMSHNGKSATGEIQWDGVENVKLGIFENTTQFNHYIQSFNINTNVWVAQYIYKRLKFMNNRHISQFASLLFLALWHGFHTGYYVCFMFEFLIIYFERDIQSMIKYNETLTNFFNSPALDLPIKILLRIYTFVFMGWSLLPFVLLRSDRYWKAFGNAYYSGIIIFMLWPILYSPLLWILLKKFKKKTV